MWKKCRHFVVTIPAKFLSVVIVIITKLKYLCDMWWQQMQWTNDVAIMWAHTIKKDVHMKMYMNCYNLFYVSVCFNIVKFKMCWNVNEMCSLYCHNATKDSFNFNCNHKVAEIPIPHVVATKAKNIWYHNCVGPHNKKRCMYENVYELL